MLNKLGITVGNDTKAANAFMKVFPNFFEVQYQKPSEYIKEFWKKYKKLPDTNSNLNGKVFEYVLATLCIRENILPVYLSAKVAFVPNVVYDIMFYTSERGPICWSVKTSLRERYKQADLEAIALKYVHRNAKNYLIMLKSDETASLKQKLKKGELLGINEVIAADDVEFDEFVDNMKKNKYINPGKVDIITGNLVK